MRNEIKEIDVTEEKWQATRNAIYAVGVAVFAALVVTEVIQAGDELQWLDLLDKVLGMIGNGLAWWFTRRKYVVKPAEGNGRYEAGVPTTTVLPDEIDPY